MPRRVYTYPAAMGWGSLNLLATLGAAVMFIALLALPRQRARQPARAAPRPATIRGARRPSSGRRRRRRRPTTSSPQPTVASAEPLWHAELTAAADRRRGLRQARSADHLRARRRARSSLSDAGPVAVAVSDGRGDQRDVRLVDLLRDRRGVGIAADLPVHDRLVLADQGQGTARARRRRKRGSRCDRACHDSPSRARRRSRRQRPPDRSPSATAASCGGRRCA